MPWPIILASVPWGRVVAAIISADRVGSVGAKWYSKMRSSGGRQPNQDSTVDSDSISALRTDVTGLQERLDTLEDNERILVSQLQSLSTRIAILSWVLVGMAAAALAAGIVALLQ